MAGKRSGCMTSRAGRQREGPRLPVLLSKLQAATNASKNGICVPPRVSLCVQHFNVTYGRGAGCVGRPEVVTRVRMSRQEPPQSEVM